MNTKLYVGNLPYSTGTKSAGAASRSTKRNRRRLARTATDLAVVAGSGATRAGRERLVLRAMRRARIGDGPGLHPSLTLSVAND